MKMQKSELVTQELTSVLSNTEVVHPSTFEQKPDDIVFKAPPSKPVDPFLEYKVPEKAIIPESGSWWLEVLKSGVILEEVQFSGKSSFTVGRLPSCAIALEHPSVSRHHCIVQFLQPNQCCLFDLSVHGTFLNKKRILKNTYVPIYDGDFVCFGASSRNFVVHGQIHPSLLETEAETHLPEPKKIDEMMMEKPLSFQMTKGSINAEEEEGDPKTLLKEWVVQQGVDLRQETYPVGEDQYFVRVWVDLAPSYLSLGLEGEETLLVGEATTESKQRSKRQAMSQILQHLDQMGLYKAEESIHLMDLERNRLKHLFEDLEEEHEKDEYYDRSRKSRFPPTKRPKVETYHSLQEQLKESLARQQVCTQALQVLKKQTQKERLEKEADEEEEEDSLEDYMQTLDHQQKHERCQLLEKESNDLTKKIAKLQKYIARVTPSSLTTSTLSNGNPGNPTFSSPSISTAVIPELLAFNESKSSPGSTNDESKMHEPIHHVSHPSLIPPNEVETVVHGRMTKVEEEAEEDIIEWLPPKSQTGDGKTSLNERYGY